MAEGGSSGDAMRETFGRYRVELKNLDKVLYPDDGITKGDVVEYSRWVAGFMQRWLDNRPLAMQRFPDGTDEEGFFQKAIPDYFPLWFCRHTVQTNDGAQQVPPGWGLRHGPQRRQRLPCSAG